MLKTAALHAQFALELWYRRMESYVLEEEFELSLCARFHTVVHVVLRLLPGVS